MSARNAVSLVICPVHLTSQAHESFSERLYLDAHRGRTHYRQLRQGGYPLGSGGIESSNKFICHVRLKRSGAWWYEGNSNQMFALRCAKYNGTLDQVFARYQQKLRETSE